MIRRPPRSTRTYTLFPYTTLFRSPGYATGIIVGDSGEILTANGTQLSGDRIRIVLADGTSHLATAVKRSRVTQLALLKIDHPTPYFFDLQDISTVHKGQWVLTVSNLFKIADGSDPPSVMLGIISLQTKLEAKRGNQPFPYEGDVLLLDSISSNPGASGGAVVDAATGTLLGMIGPNLESRSSGTKLNFAIPVRVLHSFVHGEVTEATVTATTNKAPFLGIRLFRLGGKKSPAYIDRVQRNSPASKAKLRPDDVVLGIGEERIRTIEDYDTVLKRLTPGQEIQLAVKRKSKLLQIPILVAAKPE